jgi:ATP-binding cassette subfamily B protein
MTTGDIIARATNDLNQVRSMLGPGLMYPVNAVFMMVFALAGMAYLSPALTLIALVPPIIMAVGTNRLAKVVHDRFTKVQEQYSTISTKIQENLAGIRVVKAYVREDSEVEAIKGLNTDYLKRNLLYFRAEGVLYPFFSFSHNLGRFVVLSVGGVLMLNATGGFDVGDFAAFLLYLNMLLFPMISIGWVLNVIQRGVASLVRINEVLQDVPSIQDPAEPVSKPPRRGHIVFRGVSFGYRADRRVLDSIDLEIPAGTLLGIVGPTGSGKSTLAHLIPRFQDPDEGEILIDGIPIRQYRIADLRGMIGMVSQDHFMFSNTVRKNIGFGLSPEEFVADGVIEEASRLAAFHDNVVEFPQGYETLVGERGITLSGGQRQRAAIARAIAIDPKILILDDALSSVDTHTEERILQGLRRVTKDRTTLLISHRISTVQEADRIIVLEEGRIIEEGTHAELLRLDGLYASIYRHQLLEAEIEGMTA